MLYALRGLSACQLFSCSIHPLKIRSRVYDNNKKREENEDIPANHALDKTRN
jgi:hypothetical protein